MKKPATTKAHAVPGSSVMRACCCGRGGVVGGRDGMCVGKVGFGTGFGRGKSAELIEADDDAG